MRKSNIEELSKFPDEKISFLVGDYKNRIYKAERSANNSNEGSKIEFVKALQVEYCYLRREQEVREARHAAHKRYVEKISQKVNK